MSRKDPIPRQTLEAFLDGEVTPSEANTIASQIDTQEETHTLWRDVQKQRSLFQETVQARADEAAATIDWDAFSGRVMKAIAEEAPCQVPSAASVFSFQHAPACNDTASAEERSWLAPFQSLFRWMRAHPGIAMTCTAATCLLVVLALPFLDPGPNPDNDVIVEKMSNIKSAQSLIYQTKNKATGHSITVIVFDEPPAVDETGAVVPNPSQRRPAPAPRERGKKTP